MDATKVTKVAVVGAGVMGSSIALVHARAGMEVALVDVEARLLDRALGIIRSGLETLAEHGVLKGPLPSLDRTGGPRPNHDAKPTFGRLTLHEGAQPLSSTSRPDEQIATHLDDVRVLADQHRNPCWLVGAR